MLARTLRFWALSLSLAAVCSAAEPLAAPSPQAAGRSGESQIGERSALDHLLAAAEQLQAAGLAEDAAQLREAADDIQRRIVAERDELARQISELQERAEQLRQLTGRPDKILCRCCFLELSSEALVEFEAAVERASAVANPQNAVYKNAEEVIERLKKSGKVKVVHASPQIVTAPGQPATATSGGEFPIMVPAGGETVSVEWKRFGASCQVVPRWLGTGCVELEFVPEFSQLDFKNAVNVNGVSIPGLTTQRVYAKAEMKLGETLVVKTLRSEGRDGEHPRYFLPAGAVQQASGEADAAPQPSTATLFMVTPVAVAE